MRGRRGEARRPVRRRAGRKRLGVKDGRRPPRSGAEGILDAETRPAKRAGTNEAHVTPETPPSNYLGGVATTWVVDLSLIHISEPTRPY